MRRLRPPTQGQLVRVVADILILTIAFIAGLALDNFWRGAIRGQAVPPISTYVADYTSSLPVLWAIGIGTFAASGFYTRGRLYRGRYKALALVQGSALAFLIYAAVAYSLKAYLTFPPASAIALSAAVCLGLLLLARMYSYFWKGALKDPEEPHPHRRGPGEPATVLVIGGAGYVGSALVPQLLDAGYRVRVFDSLMFGSSPLGPVLGHSDLEIVEGDFRRVDQLVQAIQGVEAVVHLGGIVGDPACALNEELTVEVNLAATRTIAELARAHRVRRFVFASTCSVYGASDEIMDERSKLNPVSLYAKSKIASERVLHSLSDESFAPTILRFGTVYGISGRTRFDLVVNLLSAKAAVDGKITVFGPGQWRPFVHVADVAQAIVRVVEAQPDTVEGRVFNVGSNAQNATLGSLGRMIHDHVPAAELIETEGDGDRRNYRVNFDRIARDLGFTPQWTLDQGIDQVLEVVTSGEVADYQAVEYSNLKSLESMVLQDSIDVLGFQHRELLEATTGYTESETQPEMGDLAKSP